MSDGSSPGRGRRRDEQGLDHVDDPVLKVEGLHKTFPVRTGLRNGLVGEVHAVDGVDLTIGRGTTVGLVGESGCGKSTLARSIMRLIDPTSGRIVFLGRDITTMSKSELRRVRRDMQIVFQDPYSSLNPRMRVWDSIAEPLRSSGRYERARVAELLEMVGLSAGDGRRLPREFSGGQRQRICIARALALEPRLLILDEPVSALDVSVRAQVVNLLQDLQRELDLSYLFVAHDLGIVRHACAEVAVMYLGKIVEIGPTEELYSHPSHPYTQALLSAVPIANPRDRGHGGRIVLSGEVPKPTHPPSGCRFRTRCWKAHGICAEQEPSLVEHGGKVRSACHFATARDVASIAG